MQTPRMLLIIEDDSVLCDLLVLCLEDKNLEVVTAPDAYHAFDILDKYLPAAIVLDINLPGMNGLQFMQKLQERGLGNLPVIVTSANHGMEYHLEQLSIAGFIPKPFDIEACRSLLFNVLHIGG